MPPRASEGCALRAKISFSCLALSCRLLLSIHSDPASHSLLPSCLLFPQINISLPLFKFQSIQASADPPSHFFFKSTVTTSLVPEPLQPLTFRLSTQPASSTHIGSPNRLCHKTLTSPGQDKKGNIHGRVSRQTNRLNKCLHKQIAARLG